MCHNTKHTEYVCNDVDDQSSWHYLLWYWETCGKQSQTGQFAQQCHFRVLFYPVICFVCKVFLRCWECVERTGSIFQFSHLSLVIIYYVSENIFVMRNHQQFQSSVFPNFFCLIKTQFISLHIDKVTDIVSLQQTHRRPLCVWLCRCVTKCEIE